MSRSSASPATSGNGSSTERMSVGDLAAPESATRPRPRQVPAWIGSVVLLAVFLASWESYVRAFQVSKLIAPPPSMVVEAWVVSLGRATFWYHTWVTCSETVLGFCFATL